MNFQQKFLMLRKQAGLSQDELADKLGVTRQAISRWEQGTACPDMFNLTQISKLFGVSADYLISDDVDEAVTVEYPSRANDLTSLRQCDKEKGVRRSDGVMSRLLIFSASAYVCALVLEICAAALWLCSYAHGDDAVSVVLLCLGVFISAAAVAFSEVFSRRMQASQRTELRVKHYKLFCLIALPGLILCATYGICTACIGLSGARLSYAAYVSLVSVLSAVVYAITAVVACLKITSRR